MLSEVVKDLLKSVVNHEAILVEEEAGQGFGRRNQRQREIHT
jgi:hypothetical protein